MDTVATRHAYYMMHNELFKFLHENYLVRITERPKGGVPLHEVGVPMLSARLHLDTSSSQTNAVMSLPRPRGSTYMVIGAGTARGAVNVAVVTAELL